MCARARACVCVVNAEPRLTPSSRGRTGLVGALGSGEHPSVPRGSPGGKRTRDAVRSSECYTVGRPSVTEGLLKEAFTCVSIAVQTGWGLRGECWRGDPSGSTWSWKACGGAQFAEQSSRGGKTLEGSDSHGGSIIHPHFTCSAPSSDQGHFLYTLPSSANWLCIREKSKKRYFFPGTFSMDLPFFKTPKETRIRHFFFLRKFFIFLFG